MLWEGFGFGWAETAYSGVTFPLVEPALEKAAKLGFRRIVVFPYFLFTGILVDRIYAATDAVAARHPEIAFVKAPYLNDHPLVIDTFVDARARDPRRAEPDELPDVQIPRADPRLRGGDRPAAGEPSPSRRGDSRRGRPLQRERRGTCLRARTTSRRMRTTTATRHDHDHAHDHRTTIPIRMPTIRSGRAR